jgi:hypothetical protein
MEHRNFDGGIIHTKTWRGKKEGLQYHTSRFDTNIKDYVDGKKIAEINSNPGNFSFKVYSKPIFEVDGKDYSLFVSRSKDGYYINLLSEIYFRKYIPYIPLTK